MSSKSLKCFTIFFARSGGLNPELEEARRVVERLSNGIAEGWGMSVRLKWGELARPSSGPPQDAINRSVDDCDLFIGLLWDEWGQPTCGYSSGFEEEFRRADRRYEQTREPDIWVYFKEVGERQLRQPGEGLTKVMAFRKEMEERHSHYYSTFSDEREFGEKLLDALLLHLQKLAGAASTASLESELEAQATLTPPSEVPPEHSVSQATPYREQAARLAQFVTDRTRGAGPSADDADQIARLYLLSAAWFYELRLNGILGIHEAYTFYTMREGLALSGEEWNLLVRSLVSDERGVRPGYYWLGHLPDAEINSLLTWYAVNDGESDVRVGSLRLLTTAGYALAEEAVRRIAVDDSAAVRRALVQYLGMRKQADDLPLLQPLLSDPEVSNDASIVRLSMIAARNADEAIEELLRLDIADLGSVPDALKKQLAVASTDSLKRLLEAKEQDLRQFAAETLGGRDDLAPESAIALARDPDVWVASPGVRALIRMGQDFTEEFKLLARRCADLRKELSRSSWSSRLRSRRDLPDEAFRLMWLRKLPPEKLLGKLSFYGDDAVDAYRVLALDHFRLVQNRLRADVSDGFQSQQEAYRQKMIAESGRAVSDSRGLDAFQKARFLEAALAGLAAHGDERDLEAARAALAEQALFFLHEGKTSAIKLLQRCGSHEDAALLLSVANDTYSGVSDLAASVAAELAPGIAGAPGQLLQSESPEAVKTALRSLLRDEQEKAKPVVRRLLSSSNFSIRNAAAAFLIVVSDKEELSRLLVEYHTQSPCYYSVVCLLDKALYAPGRLGEAFMEEIRQLLQ